MTNKHILIESAAKKYYLQQLKTHAVIICLPFNEGEEVLINLNLITIDHDGLSYIFFCKSITCV